MLIDIHAHLAQDFPAGNDLLVLNATESREEAENALKIYSINNRILPCVGLHPNKIVNMSKENINKSLEYIQNNIDKFFAISEVGLDFKEKSEEQIKLQEDILSRILGIAESKGKVAIVHTRKSIRRFLEIRSSYRVKIIYHNYEGNVSLLSRIYELGDAVSISTGFLKFKKDEVIKKVNLNYLFFETDSPTLSPSDLPNAPSNVSLIYEYFARLRNIDLRELELQVQKNFEAIFKTYF
jgi:TatD family hydrolase